MTQNQINFAKLREDIRHNKATEGYSAIELQETKRHNVSSEGINWYSAKESGRHNEATEGLNWYLAPSQVYQNTTRGDLNVAQAEQTQEETKLLIPKYDLDVAKQQLQREIFEQQKYMDSVTEKNESAKREIESRNADIAYQAMAHQAEEWSRRYNFDLNKFYNSEFWERWSRTLNNGSNSSSKMKSLIDQFVNELAKWLGFELPEDNNDPTFKRPSGGRRGPTTRGRGHTIQVK